VVPSPPSVVSCTCMMRRVGCSGRCIKIKRITCGLSQKVASSLPPPLFPLHDVINEQSLGAGTRCSSMEGKRSLHAGQQSVRHQIVDHETFKPQRHTHFPSFTALCLPHQHGGSPTVSATRTHLHTQARHSRQNWMPVVGQKFLTQPVTMPLDQIRWGAAPPLHFQTVNPIHVGAGC
jgi:hypothetical protein